MTLATKQNRQPEGIPTGGQYAATPHSEAGVTLQAPTVPAHPELAGFEIPAPLEGQKFLDGTPITATSFEEAYEEFFRPLEDFEAAHGDWQTTRAPSDEALLELTGVDKAKLGRVGGVFLEVDEKTGEPLIEVNTRNAGYCYENGCDGSCDACLEDDIHTLPGFVRTTNDEGDVSHFFRPFDPAAAQRHLADKKTRDILNHRLYARESITSGRQPPWAILSQIRSGEERRKLADELTTARRRASRWRDDLSYADAVTAALDGGTAIPSPRIRQSRPNGQIGYEIGNESLARSTAAAAEARTAAETLHAELERGLPPAATALVAAEHTRLEKAASKADEQAQRSRDEIVKGAALMRAWASRLHSQATPELTTVTNLEAAMRDFDWSSSWPGDPADCPPAPAVSGK